MKSWKKPSSTFLYRYVLLSWVSSYSVTYALIKKLHEKNWNMQRQDRLCRSREEGLNVAKEIIVGDGDLNEPAKISNLTGKWKSQRVILFARVKFSFFLYNFTKKNCSTFCKIIEQYYIRWKAVKTNLHVYDATKM